MTTSRPRAAGVVLLAATAAPLLARCNRSGAARPAATTPATSGGRATHAARDASAADATDAPAPGPAAACAGDCAQDAGPPPAPGSIDLDAVAATLRREATTLRSCFDRARARNPHVSGQFDVSFTIGTDGRVVGAPEASGLPEAPELRNCVASRVRYIVFPPAVGGPVDVSFPFTVQPGG